MTHWDHLSLRSKAWVMAKLYLLVCSDRPIRLLLLQSTAAWALFGALTAAAVQYFGPWPAAALAVLAAWTFESWLMTIAAHTIALAKVKGQPEDPGPGPQPPDQGPA